MIQSPETNDMLSPQQSADRIHSSSSSSSSSAQPKAPRSSMARVIHSYAGKYRGFTFHAGVIPSEERESASVGALRNAMQKSGSHCWPIHFVVTDKGILVHSRESSKKRSIKGLGGGRQELPTSSEALFKVPLHRVATIMLCAKKPRTTKATALVIIAQYNHPKSGMGMACHVVTMHDPKEAQHALNLLDSVVTAAYEQRMQADREKKAGGSGSSAPPSATRQDNSQPDDDEYVYVDDHPDAGQGGDGGDGSDEEEEEADGGDGDADFAELGVHTYNPSSRRPPQCIAFGSDDDDDDAQDSSMAAMQTGYGAVREASQELDDETEC